MEKMLALGVVLSAYDQLSPALGKATEKINKYDKQIKALGGSMAKYGTMSLAAGSAITSGIGSAVTTYQDLAAAQGEISSLGIGEEGLKKITKAAMEFSGQYAGTTAPEFVRASYDIKSGIASLSDEGVAQFTKLAATTATATKSSTEEMTKLFALGHGIYRSQFNSDFEFGKKFSSAISTAVQAFRTDGSDLVQGLSNLGASATSMGVSLSEQLSIIGVSKSAFNSASEAATSYRAFLQGVGNAQEKLGLQFTDSAGNMLPMKTILEDIKHKYGDISSVEVQDELKKAFGSAEAVKMLTALLDKTDDLSAAQQNLNKNMAAGTKITEEMAMKMNKGREFEILEQKMGNASALIGRAFAPAALKLGNAIGYIVDKTSAWIDENPKTAETLGWVVAGAAGLLTVVGTLGITVGGFLMVLPTLTAGLAAVKVGLFAVGGAMKAVSMAFLSNPIVAIATVIGLAAYTIYKRWEPLKQWFLEVFAIFRKEFAWIGTAIDKVKSIGPSVKSFFGFGSDDKKTAAVSSRAMKINKPAAQNMAQTNHIKVNVNNPSSNVDVEKAIVSAMNKGGADRGLSDEDI